MQDKNKYVLTGEYQASSGSQIRLNAMNVPRGSVVVTAGGVTLTENSDYTVDYNMGIVTILNQSIIDAGTSINVSMENQSMFSTQRKTLLGLDLNYQFNKDFNIGATVMHFSERSITEKVAIGSETINNTIWGLNLSYNNKFMWLTNLLGKIPTVNATAPSSVSLTAEFAQLIPHAQKTGSTKGSSYIDDFESTQSGIDLRSPYSWFLYRPPLPLFLVPRFDSIRQLQRSTFPRSGIEQQYRIWQKPCPPRLVLHRQDVHPAQFVERARIHQKRRGATVQLVCARNHTTRVVPRQGAQLWRVFDYPNSQPLVLPRGTRSV